MFTFYEVLFLRWFCPAVTWPSCMPWLVMTPVTLVTVVNAKVTANMVSRGRIFDRRRDFIDIEIVCKKYIVSPLKKNSKHMLVLM